MMKSVEGIFRNGKVELSEPVPASAEGPVLVTFLSSSRQINLQKLGINSEQAADLRTRLGAIAEDWDRPEMDIYDDL